MKIEWKQCFKVGGKCIYIIFMYKLLERGGKHHRSVL